MNTKIKLLGATILALGISAGTAQAAALQFGELVLNFSGTSVTTDPVGTSLGTLPLSFTISPDKATVQNIFDDFTSDANLTIGSTVNPFTTGGGDAVFNIGTADSSLTWGGTFSALDPNVGKFTAQTVSLVGLPTATSVTYLVQGTFLVGSDFSNAGTTINAKEQVNFQTIAGNNLGGSVTFSTSVPEPSTLSLFGAALVGFGFLQLRKKRKPASLA